MKTFYMFYFFNNGINISIINYGKRTIITNVSIVGYRKKLTVFQMIRAYAYL